MPKCQNENAKCQNAKTPKCLNAWNFHVAAGRARRSSGTTPRITFVLPLITARGRALKSRGIRCSTSFSRAPRISLATSDLNVISTSRWYLTWHSTGRNEVVEHGLANSNQSGSKIFKHGQSDRLIRTPTMTRASQREFILDDPHPHFQSSTDLVIHLFISSLQQ